MTPIGIIARIKSPLLRVPLLYAWFPFEVLLSFGQILFLDRTPARLFRREYWRQAAASFWIAHDGLFQDLP